MKTVSKLFLAAAVISLALSYTRLSDFLGGILKPAGVIFFMVFFISNLFPDREWEQFEEDNRLREQLIKEKKGSPESEEASRPQRAAYAHAR
jgi:sortase (surface protein transpeptidase)